MRLIETFVSYNNNWSLQWIHARKETSSCVRYMQRAFQLILIMSIFSFTFIQGADILFGGERVILPEPFASAYYLSPCVIANCTDNMAIVKEEIFGAVACILPFDTEDEAIQRANSSQFGLAGGVFTKYLFSTLSSNRNLNICSYMYSVFILGT